MNGGHLVVVKKSVFIEEIWLFPLDNIPIKIYNVYRGKKGGDKNASR